MEVMKNNLKMSVALKVFLILMLFLSANDLVSWSYGLTLKPGFIIIVMFSVVSGVFLLNERGYKHALFLKDALIVFWIFLCILFCILNSNSRNDIYTFAAIIYVVMVLSAKLSYFSKNKNNVLAVFITSGILLSLIGVIQFIMGLLGLGEFVFIKQWWYEGVIARVNGLSYEPSYYGLVITPFFVFSSLLSGTDKEMVVGSKKINLLFVLSGIALIISSSRASLLFNIIFWLFLLVYKGVAFGKSVLLKDIMKLTCFIVAIIIFFASVSFFVNYLAIFERNHISQAQSVDKSAFIQESNSAENIPSSNETSSVAENNFLEPNSLPHIADESSLKIIDQPPSSVDRHVVSDPAQKCLEKPCLDKDLSDLREKKEDNDSNNKLIYTAQSSLTTASTDNVIYDKHQDVVISEDKVTYPHYQGIFSGTGLEGEPSHSVSIRWNDMENTIDVAKMHLWKGVGLGGVAYEIAKNKGVQNVSPDIIRNYEGLVPIIEISAATGIVGAVSFLLWIASITVPSIIRVLRVKNISADSYITASLSISLLSQFALMQCNQNIMRMYFWLNLFVVMVFVYTQDLKKRTGNKKS